MAALGMRPLWGKQSIPISLIRLLTISQATHKTPSRVRGPKEFWGQLDNTVVHQINKSSGELSSCRLVYDVHKLRARYHQTFLKVIRCWACYWHGGIYPIHLTSWTVGPTNKDTGTQI